MRIVAGAFRGRPLVAPKGHSVRPTADRVRQAIFNVLAHAAWAPDLAGARVLDLFAGSGALGIEALSRGSAFALFVERDTAAAGAIRANLEGLALEGRGRIERRDATQIGPCPVAPFDVAFLDPPYGKDLAAPALAQLVAGGWLAPGAVAVAERGERDPAPAVDGYETIAERVWGAARVGFLRRVALPPR